MRNRVSNRHPIKAHPFFSNDQGDNLFDQKQLKLGTVRYVGIGLPGGKALTTLGLQQVGTRDWLKTLRPAMHGTSKYGMVRKKAGLISELYFPVMVGELGVTQRGCRGPGQTL